MTGERLARVGGGWSTFLVCDSVDGAPPAGVAAGGRWVVHLPGVRFGGWGTAGPGATR